MLAHIISVFSLSYFLPCVLVFLVVLMGIISLSSFCWEDFCFLMHYLIKLLFWHCFRITIVCTDDSPIQPFFLQMIRTVRLENLFCIFDPDHPDWPPSTEEGILGKYFCIFDPNHSDRPLAKRTVRWENLFAFFIQIIQMGRPLAKSSVFYEKKFALLIWIIQMGQALAKWKMCDWFTRSNILRILTPKFVKVTWQNP